MSTKNVVVTKRPDLISTTPTASTYVGLSQTELLVKVKLLHEQILKTNKYLLEVHRISLYNWDENDSGTIMVEMPGDKKGFLLDKILRLRGAWNPETNTPQLLKEDTNKIGWVYTVDTTTPTTRFDIGWKKGDYAFYDEEGNLYNVQAKMLESLFTPIVPIESDTIQMDPITQNSSGILLRAHVKVDPTDENDISVSARGLYVDAYKRAKQLITVTEVAPTADNTEGGFRIVYLTQLPSQLYHGYLYLIPPHSIIIEE